VVSAKTLYTGDRGIQDNAYHFVDPASDSYARGSGAAGAKFIFDKSGAADPRRTVPVTPWP
jgi:hypothetical protein